MRWIARLFAVLLLLVIVGAIWAVVGVTRRGISARDQPTAVEVSLAGGLRRLAIPAHQRNLRNPAPADDAALKEGMEHFADHCALCHGNDGKGSMMGRNMYPKAPDMTSAGTQSLTDGEIFYIIKNGVRLTGMPAWGGEGHGEQDDWHLVQFIRHLPKITPEELHAMEELNPKSKHDMNEEEDENRFLSGDEGHESPEHHH